MGRYDVGKIEASPISKPYHRQVYCRQQGECTRYVECLDEHVIRPKEEQPLNFRSFTGQCYVKPEFKAPREQSARSVKFVCAESTSPRRTGG